MRVLTHRIEAVSVNGKENFFYGFSAILSDACTSCCKFYSHLNVFFFFKYNLQIII